MAEASDDVSAWALLGSTPELRSLAARYGRPLTCFDFDAEVFDALAALVAPPCTARLICADWLAAEWDAPFDLAFADGSINMLPPDKQETLLQRTQEMLEPGGLALFRVHVALAPRFRDAEEVFAWHRSHSAEQPVFSRTRTDLDMLWLDPATLRIDFPECHRKIRELFGRGAITAAEFEAYDRLLEFNKIALYYMTRESFEALAVKYFEIESARCGDDYSGSPSHPIYALRKK